MSEEHELLREISALETTLQRSASLGDDSRREMVELRRRIATVIATISKLGEAVFATDPQRSAFKAELARMRAATALHHASWPIVAIDRGDPRYQSSISTAREANKKFIDWVRLQCNPIILR